MKEAVHRGPIHLYDIVGRAKHPCAGVALARDHIAVFHLGKWTGASAYFHWAAIHLEETYRCAEVGASSHRRGKKDWSKGCADDRDQSDCEGDGEDAAIHWRGLTGLE